MGAPGIPRRAGIGPTPLSASQRQLWYLSQVAPQSPVYNELVTLRKAGSFDPEAFRSAFGEFVRRHEAWRTTFAIIDGEPCQVVHATTAFELPLLDLSRLPSAEAERQAAELAAEDTRRPYDLAVGPLLRPRLVRLEDGEHRLYLGLHHLIFDGVTLYRVLLPEIVALYDAAVAGLPSPLPEPPVQYPDYAAWELAWVDSPAVAARIARWRTRLAGATPLALPLDHPRPARRRFAGGLVPFAVEATTVEGLRAVGRRSGASLFQVVAALYAWWLSRYTGRDDVTFATVSDLRQRPELVGMAGYCLAPVVIRADVSAEPVEGRGDRAGPGLTVDELVRRVRGAVLDGLDDMVPFEPLVRELGGVRDPRLNPIFQASLALEPPMIISDPQWSLHQMEHAVGQAVGQSKFDLSIELDERPDGHVDGRLSYDADLFEATSAELMTQHWLRLVAAVAAAPDQPLGELDLVGPRERQRRLEGWRPAVPDRPGCVHELIREQVARTPDAVAVVAGGRQLTYRELDQAANVVAGRLTAAGAGPGTVVATVLGRSVDLVVGLLGVLLSGAAYLPLNPSDPAAHREYLVADSGAAVLLADAGLVSGLGALAIPVVTVTGALDEPPAGRRPSETVGPGDLAYLLYTSGSTGRPKGVLVEHRNVTDLMATLFQAMGITGSDTVVSVASYTFDMSVGDIFCTLGLGGRLVLASAEQAADPRALAALLDTSGATFLTATPTMWSALLEAGWEGDPHLVADCGGEPLTEPLGRALVERCAAVWNCYGPTEATDVAACGRVAVGDPSTVGRALAGTRVYVLDDRGRPVPPGVPGEVVLGGPGVARGYLNRPEETALRFADDPFVEGGRSYRTGDRGRLLADGRLQILGRLDDQVKVRGVRIEPGEIEAVLLAHPDIAAAVVTARSTSAGDPDDPDAGDRELVAYVVARSAATGDRQLRGWLRARLPASLVPAVIVGLPALPLMPSGKVDRSALPEPRRGVAGVGAGPDGQPPGTATQVRMAAVWSRTLRAEVVDVDADFFDLGGHSLLAARLIVEIEREFGVAVPLAEFLQRATVAGLAELIDGTADAGAAGEPAGVVRPLYFVYPDVTAAVSVRHFTDAWGSVQSVQPLLPRQLYGRFDRSEGLEGLARPMLAAIRAQQPHGPYALAGYSLGGLVAYELARQLAEAGESVDWLAILDTSTPAIAGETFRSWFRPVTRMDRHRERTRRQRWEKYAEVLVRNLERPLVGLRLRHATPPTDFDYRGALELARDYRRPGHDIPMQLFVTADSVAEVGQDALGWDVMHRGPLQRHSLPGGHITLLQPPQVDVVAGLLLRSLHNARGSAGARQSALSR